NLRERRRGGGGGAPPSRGVPFLVQRRRRRRRRRVVVVLVGERAGLVVEVVVLAAVVGIAAGRDAVAGLEDGGGGGGGGGVCAVEVLAVALPQRQPRERQYRGEAAVLAAVIETPPVARETLDVAVVSVSATAAAPAMSSLRELATRLAPPAALLKIARHVVSFVPVAAAAGMLRR
ncbi:unnamed protein product, partial [Ectocarpus sp. 8 AP-2014]